MTKMLKFKLPKKVVKEYNETNKEISRLMGTQTYYQMQRDGSFRTVLLPKRKYSLGIDWEPYGKKGTITILFCWFSMSGRRKYDWLMNARRYNFILVMGKNIPYVRKIDSMSCC